MAVGLMATPAAASDGVSGVVQDFFEWSVNAQRETGDAFWRAIYGDSWNADGGFTDGVGADRTELVEKYGSYTDTMQADLTTQTLVSDGAVRLYFTFPDMWFYNLTKESFSGSEELYTGYGLYTLSTGYTFWISVGDAALNASKITAPFAGDYVYGSYAVCDYPADVTVGYGSDPVSVSKGGNIPAQGIRMTSTSVGVKDERYGASFSEWVDLTPASGLSSLTTLDISEPSRAGSIAGDVYVVNENGEETVYNDYSVVNETTNIYNDPISGTERPMEEWAYDYIERQYNITLEDGASVTVKYGDENIEIVEGDSIETLNYGSGNSGEGGGDDDGGGTGIGDAIANLFTVLGEIILGLITALINLATKALDALKGLFDLFGQLVETITGFFGGFTDFLAGVFPFLPEETFTIFNFGLILLVAATVFRKFLK